MAAYEVAELALESSYKGAVETLRRTLEEGGPSRGSVEAAAGDGVGMQGREAGSAKPEGSTSADNAPKSMKSVDEPMRTQSCFSMLVPVATSALSAQI